METKEAKPNYWKVVHAEAKRLHQTPTYSGLPYKEALAVAKERESATRRKDLYSDIQKLLFQVATKPAFKDIRDLLEETSISILKAFDSITHKNKLEEVSVAYLQSLGYTIISPTLTAPGAVAPKAEEPKEEVVAPEVAPEVAPAPVVEEASTLAPPAPIATPPQEEDEEFGGIWVNGKPLFIDNNYINSLQPGKHVSKKIQGLTVQEILDEVQHSNWNGTIYPSLLNINHNPHKYRRIYLHNKDYNIDLHTANILQTVAKKAKELDESYHTMLGVLRNDWYEKIYKNIVTIEEDNKLHTYLVTIRKTLKDVFIKATVKETVTCFKGTERTQTEKVTKLESEDEYKFFMSQNSILFRKNKVEQLQEAL